MMEPAIKFCTTCGGPTEKKIPEDDDHIREVCTACGQIHYHNPKVVVGTIPEADDGRILLCKRDIEPRKGKWTLPAGFLESQESVQDGALRETFEETRARVEIIAPYRLFNIVFVDQIYFMFRARLTTYDFGPTSESVEVRLFEHRDIPWDEIAFEVIRQTLDHYLNDLQKAEFPFKVCDLHQSQILNF